MMRVGVERRRQHDPARQPQRHRRTRQRALDHDGRQRAADDDQEGGQLQQRAEASAFEQLPADDGNGGECESDEAELVHAR
jgi:hypothetical protein